MPSTQRHCSSLLSQAKLKECENPQLPSMRSINYGSTVISLFRNSPISLCSDLLSRRLRIRSCFSLPSYSPSLSNLRPPNLHSFVQNPPIQTSISMNANKEPKRRSAELPPRRGQIKIKMFKTIFNIVKSTSPEEIGRSRRENETLTSTSTTPVPNSSGYNSETQSEL